MYKSFSGVVQHGEKVGHNFGVATANIHIQSSLSIKDGVYFSDVIIEQEKYSSIMHYGDLKTFGREKTLEIHIFDFNKDIYEKEIQITPLKYHRETKKFQNADQLFTQIEDDITQAEKFFLRQQILKQWDQLSPKETEKLHTDAYKAITQDEFFTNAKTIAIYAGREHELQFAKQLCENHPEKKYLFPKVISSTELVFIQSTYADLVPGKYDILEPQTNTHTDLTEIDLIITPALGADKNNVRLGQGGGYYDRLLSTYTGKSICIVPKFAAFDTVPKNKYDQKVTKKIIL